MLFWWNCFASFCLVAFGQGSWISGLGMAAAAFGITLFWRAMLRLPKPRDRFWLSVGWFTAVQSVQLSWMTSIHYMGPLILIIYALLTVGIGVQFGCLSFFFSKRGISLSRCFAGAGCWVLFEWMRLYLLSGFTWNPIGLSLADNSLSIQWAALFGVYGLSFWVIFVNLFGIYAAQLWKRRAMWGVCILLPYLFGGVHQWWIEKTLTTEKTLSVVLIQTAFLPEQKDAMAHLSAVFIPPLNQWERICHALNDRRLLGEQKTFDLIVLPEAVVSMGAYTPAYPIDLILGFWEDQFGKSALSDLPPLEPPLASFSLGQNGWRVTNAFIAQSIANHFNTHIIAGLDDREGSLQYNAAFHFEAHATPPKRYEKRVLVPIGEYIPFANIRWISQFLVKQFGMGDSFHVGTEAKLFFSPLPVGVSICLEETYSNLVRDLRRHGARLLVNVSNDVWFPHSRLPKQHLQHGRLRAAENGVCVLRSCNTGITGGIDCFGRVLATLPPSETEMNILHLDFPVRSFATLYTWWGDGAILSVSVCCLLFLPLLALGKKKLPLNSSLR